MNFEEIFEKDILHYADSSKFCSVGFGGQFEWLILPKTSQDFCEYISFLNNKQTPYKVLGNMTNIIPQDGLMKGIFVSTKLIKEPPKVVGNRIIANAGASLFEVCKVALEHELGGIEKLCGIPGTVGGAIFNNAGAFGTEIANVLESVLVIDGLEMKSLPVADLGLNYRTSNFKTNKQIILSATFMLHSSNKNDIISTMRECAKKRSQTQPQAASAGSVFKRTALGAAGMLLDKCGLKGKTCGGAEISKKHANFVINNGGATCQDYKTLVKLATDTVWQNFGIELEREVEYLGENNESNSRLSHT
ncbi:MAG: UDP-N-acetylmuramate dehydrogenase [Clostridia bacterium]|nr:UDP-N-acetylmuramate dehydrogenase [Clostridia bacterium]